jgi:hypothetical protein
MLNIDIDIDIDHYKVIDATRTWELDLSWLADYAVQTHHVSHASIYAGEPLLTRFASECVDLETGETLVIPAGSIVASLTGDTVCGSPANESHEECGCSNRQPFHVVGYRGRVYAVRHGAAQPVRHLVPGFAPSAPALTSRACSAQLAEWVRMETALLRSQSDYAHDVALVFQAFIRGTFRHDWGDQWGIYAADIRDAIGEYAPWPVDWDDAVARVALMRLAQSGDTGGLPADSRMWSVALAGWVVPGAVSHDYVGSGKPWMPVFTALTRGLLTMEPDTLALAVDAQRQRYKRVCGDFTVAWRAMWDVLDTAAEREEWCGEYEATAAYIAARVRTRGLTFAERDMERDYHVMGSADVSVTIRLNLPVSTTMTASSPDDLYLDPYDAAESVDLESWAEGLALAVRTASDDREASAIMRESLRISDVLVEDAYMDDWDQIQ